MKEVRICWAGAALACLVLATVPSPAPALESEVVPVAHSPAAARPAPGAAMASAPVLGSPSISVSANVALGADSNVFKDGVVFLWDDDAANTALGREALGSAVGTTVSNTAVGHQALASTTASGNTAVGAMALATNSSGPANTALGALALLSNTTGGWNTAVGSWALRFNETGSANAAVGRNAQLFNTTGSGNTASGSEALRYNSTGDLNTASGRAALFWNVSGAHNTATGFLALGYGVSGDRNVALGSLSGWRLGYSVLTPTTSMSDNLYIANEGMEDEEGTIRIGTSDPDAALGVHQRAFIAGIRGVTTGQGDGVPVLIDSDGQLGTLSSSREVKQDIRDLGDMGRRLLDLRVVAFRYKAHVERGGEAVHFGLLAEEVAEAFPELVVFGADGRAQAVRYHLLSALLLGELQRQEREHRRELEALRSRVEALEGQAR
jgi:hypothetical protein